MFVTDVLPLVPFELEEGITHEEALTLINMDALAVTDATGAGDDGEAKSAKTLATGASLDGNASHEDDNNEATRNGFLRIGSGSTSDGKNANCTLTAFKTSASNNFSLSLSLSI